MCPFNTPIKRRQCVENKNIGHGVPGKSGHGMAENQKKRAAGPPKRSEEPLPPTNQPQLSLTMTHFVFPLFVTGCSTVLNKKSEQQTEDIEEHQNLYFMTGPYSAVYAFFLLHCF